MRTIGSILVCIAALTGAASPVRAEEASGMGGYGVSVTCLLVPYRHCALSISGESLGSNVDPAGFVVALEGKNIFIPAGNYRGRWNVVSSRDRSSSLDVDLLIVDGRAHLLVKSSVQKILLRQIHGRRWAFSWESDPLPLSIRNFAVKQGEIRATLLYENQEVGSADDMMWPAKGCWLNEVQCVPH